MRAPQGPRAPLSSQTARKDLSATIAAAGCLARQILKLDLRMPAPRITQKEWMQQTIDGSIIASRTRQITHDDLFDEEWSNFKDHFQDGDELWHFRTPQETWTEFFPRCGMEGYALIRGDKVVAKILTSIS